MATVTREKLYKEVWSEPMTTVAKRYEVSSNYLARICEQLRVPRPSQGYWQQLAAGRTIERAQLPEADPGDKVVWKRGEETNYYPPVASAQVHRTRRTQDAKGGTPENSPLAGCGP
jgi:hypothetical protein